MKKLLSLFLFLVSLPAYSAVDSSQVEKAEKYLNSITGLSGNFTQIANGKKDSGDFSMLRPGRVRLDYSSLPVQLIADGKDLYFFDKSLDQITTVPLTSTPAGILIRKHIDLRNSDITVSDTQTDAKTFSLKMHLRNNEGVGNMTVVFDNDPVRLDSWTVVDATGTKTEVVFNGLKTKTDFGKNYFQIQRHKTVSVAGGDSYYD
ncbi:MAG TPA: outer membrane lipoprotein carrier protein LolA [Alphaproteobacteria bacterium]|nr:outer membrane lipoprotein carrier protein LolA [Alphaproteobacteria bacterium]